MLSRSEVDYDLRGLNRLVSGLEGALFGRGEDGDLHRVLRVEAGQLAWDISNQLGPKSKEENDEKIEKDVKKFLTTLPEYSNLDDERQYSGYADFTWLQAGPNFLLGINDEDNQTGASAKDVVGFLRAGQATGSRGKAYVELGTRGKQHVMRLNRTRVSKSAFRAAVKSIRDKFGILRASFAWTAAQLIPGKRVPAFVARHFDTRAQGRAIFNDAGLNHPTEPYLEFGSTAKGVESNPYIVDAIGGAVGRRKEILKSKIKKVMAGYAYDWNTGQVFNRREAQSEDA